MKKTNKDFLEFLGLKVGDKIKIEDEQNREYEIISKTGSIFSLKRRESNPFETVFTYISLDYLLDKEYKIVEKPKKLGEMKCGEKRCDSCPLRMLDCLINKVGDITLYEMLDEVCEYRKIDKENNLYKVFKEMLDSDC